MGEPLANYKRVIAAVRRICDPSPDGLGISQRSVTMSTVGLVPAIRKLIEHMTREQVLAGILHEVAEQRNTAQEEADPVKRERMLRHARSREDLAEEEADAIAADIADNEQTALSLRVPTSLSVALKARAAAERIPTSALVRRILTQALAAHPSASALTADQIEQVEQIARRIYRESA
jgi:predicted DNA binding CopG/RHH family protein